MDTWGKTQEMREDSSGSSEPCLEESAHRIPEKLSLPRSDHFPRGFSLPNARQVDNG